MGASVPVENSHSPIGVRRFRSLRAIDALLGQASPLVAGRVLAALLTFSVPLVLARHLSREEYGIYKQFFLVVVTITLSGQIGLTQSLYYFLPRLRDRAERGAYVVQAVLGLTVVGTACGLVVALVPWFGPYRYALAAFVAVGLATAPLESTLTSQGRIGA